MRRGRACGRQAGSAEPTGVVEVLLTEQVSSEASPRENVWRALVKPAKKVRAGETLLFAAVPGDDPLLRAEVIAEGEFGERTLRFEPLRNFHAVLEKIGHMPLPPYIRREKGEADTAEDRERYQTVYSRPFGGAGSREQEVGNRVRGPEHSGHGAENVAGGRCGGGCARRNAGVSPLRLRLRSR